MPYPNVSTILYFLHPTKKYKLFFHQNGRWSFLFSSIRTVACAFVHLAFRGLRPAVKSLYILQKCNEWFLAPMLPSAKLLCPWFEFRACSEHASLNRKPTDWFESCPWILNALESRVEENQIPFPRMNFESRLCLPWNFRVWKNSSAGQCLAVRLRVRFVGYTLEWFLYTKVFDISEHCFHPFHPVSRRLGRSSSNVVFLNFNFDHNYENGGWGKGEPSSSNP